MAGGLAHFDSAVGRCGLAWIEDARRGPLIRALQLPPAGAAMDARLRQRCPTADVLEPPAAIAAAIQAIVSLLAGSRTDLRPIAIDLDDLPAFDRRVYEATREIPAGATRSYGDLAAAIGAPDAARAVGRALGLNPIPLVVPCHRVVAADGRLHGFSAPGGLRTKQRLLDLECAAVARRLPFEAPTGTPDF